MIGVIGGTLLLENEFLAERKEIEVKTPFGIAEIDLGNLNGINIAVIQRHGRKKNKPPHMINHQANFYAFKSLGVEKVIGLGSAGCLKENIEIPALIIPQDYIDFFSSTTVFNDSLVYITPGFDESIRRALIETAKKVSSLPVIDRGVYFQTRGPRLETRAEIAMIKNFADCVGMTAGSEATVAKELGIKYAVICTMDNYAHGIRGEEVNYEVIIKRARENAKICLEIVRRAIEMLYEL
ncbi:MAG: MTAP family purine nucleoside phosphorylase [Archaeoglobaceae archaeon]|nr:MTAP family purine nucleoside phosphorylase [Archaeoglobaceae archaeon]MDW8118278.1 MTAP family purine nucleoside phosphorylase [Archaeoglobaceae archaeon]